MLSPHTSLSPKTSSCPEAGDTVLATTRREATRQRRSRRASLQLAFWVGHDASWYVRSRLTPEVSHAGPRTQVNPRLPGKPRALPGVGSSDLVRQSKVHRLKNLRPTPTNSP